MKFCSKHSQFLVKTNSVASHRKVSSQAGFSLQNGDTFSFISAFLVEKLKVKIFPKQSINTHSLYTNDFLFCRNCLVLVSHCNCFRLQGKTLLPLRTE